MEFGARRTMMLHHLPHEIILDILSRFPYEDALRYKEVCKTWRKLFSHIKRDQKLNLLFVSKHESHDFYGAKLDRMQLYHGEYDEKINNKLGEQLSCKALAPLGYPCIPKHSLSQVYTMKNRTYPPMVGSHRGLVCFYETHNNVDDPIYICNPFTQETVFLPKFPKLREDAKKETVPLPPEDAKKDFLVSGFGYLYATNEYKIVRIHYNPSRIQGGQVQVYTIGDKNGWRNKETTCYSLSKSNGVLSDGALHWVDGMDLDIVAFNLADEEFRTVPRPSCLPIKEYDYNQLLMLGGYLSIVVRRHAHGTDIWSLKDTENKSGGKHWSKEFTILSEGYSYPPTYHPFYLTEENKVLMFKREPYWLGRPGTLCHYDPKTKTLENFGDADAHADAEIFKKFQAIPYMKSDVSLKVLEPDLPSINWDHFDFGDAITYYSD